MDIQSNTIPSFPSEPVDVGKIEKELASMWSGASAGDEETGALGLTRACALNLVVYATPEEDRELLQAFLNRVSESHPGRTLILVAHREESSPRLEAYVSMQRHPSGSASKQVCGEQVTIEAAGSMVETAGTAVAPLLVPDVPVYLWWKDIPHYEDKLFDRLARMADRIVIDSAAFDHPFEDLLKLSATIGDQSHPKRVSDLNWGRLTSWRTLLASFWDVPAYLDLLDRVNRLSIEFSPGIGPVEPEALLLAGWLASRLGWTVTGETREADDALECVLKCDDRVVLVRFRADKSSSPNDGQLSSVKFAVDDTAEFSVRLRAQGTQLETTARIGADHAVGRLLAYEVHSEADRLSRELSFLTRDAIFEAAVKTAAELVNALSTQNG